MSAETYEKPYKDYEFIQVDKGCVWGYRPNMELIREVSGSEDWKKVEKEFGRFLDDMDELNLGPITGLLMKMSGVYVITNDLFCEKKIKKREEMKYEVTNDLFHEDLSYKFEDQPIIGVSHVFETLEETMGALRRYWNLGYDTVVRDLWANRKQVDKKLGWLI